MYNLFIESFAMDAGIKTKYAERVLLNHLELLKLLQQTMQKELLKKMKKQLQKNQK
jgi:hypothetical protein